MTGGGTAACSWTYPESKTRPGGMFPPGRSSLLFSLPLSSLIHILCFGINLIFHYFSRMIVSIHYSRPKSQFTDTSKILARAFNSISDTGRFCPSRRDKAGMLMSTPANCNLANRSTCFIFFAFRACVTRAPIRFRLPRASFLVFKASPP